MDKVLCELSAPSGASNHQREIRQYLWSHRSEKETELAVISGDECLNLHRAIILPLSSHLMDIFPSSCPCSVPAICLPPYPSHVLTAAFEILYTGSTNIAAFKEDHVQVKEVFALLKIKADVDEDKNIGGEHNTGVVVGEGIGKVESNYDKDPLAVLQNGDQITPSDHEIHSGYLNEVTGVFDCGKKDNVSEFNERSFCTAIQSQGKTDENDNKIIPQAGEQITPVHEGIQSYCLSEVTGLFYNADKPVLFDKNPSVLKRNLNDVTHNKGENDKMVIKLNESLKKGEQDLSRCPKRRYLTKMNYLGPEEKQISSSFQTQNRKTKKRKAKAKELNDVGGEMDCNFLPTESKTQCEKMTGLDGNILSSKLKTLTGNKKQKMTGLDGSILSSLAMSHPEYKEEMAGQDGNFLSSKSKPQPGSKKPKSATDQLPSKFRCDKCDYTTKIKDVLKRHINGVHQKIPISCDQCDYTTTWTANLDRHVDAVHRKISYRCDQCDFTTTWRENVQKHIDAMHKGIFYNCDQCDYTTPWKGTLKNHIDAVHEKISYECHKCDFTTMWKETLKKHIYAHQNPYNCDQCDFGTMYKSSLQRHIDGAHKKISFKCDRCDYATAWKECLKKHLEGTHEKISYKCDQCAYATVWKQNIKKHIDSVHLKNSHKCDQCDFTTTWKESLLKHIDGLHAGVSRSLYQGSSKAATKTTDTSHDSVHSDGTGMGQVKTEKMSADQVASVIPSPESDNRELTGKCIKTEKV